MQNILKCFSNNQPEISNPIRQRVLKYLTDNDWSSIQQGEHSINVRVRCTNAVFPIYIYTFEESRIIQVYSYLEASIPENKRSAVSDFCTRVNYDLLIGNLEFNLDEGDVKYKTSIALGENIEFLTDEVIDNLIEFNYINMDKYYPGIMRILYSNDTNIKKIIEEIENPVST
jgi:Uncharacterized conserved protein